MNLYQLTAEQARIEALLEENGGEITPEIEEALTLTAEALPRKVDGYGVLIRQFAAAEAACDAEIKRLQGLKKTAVNAQKSMKGRILDAMQTFGFDKLAGETTKFSTRASKAVEVDEDTLLARYREKIAEFAATLPDWLSIEPKVSKTAISNEYKATGMTPEGAQVVENTSLIIK
jgi:hypothetical protein